MPENINNRGFAILSLLIAFSVLMISGFFVFSVYNSKFNETKLVSNDDSVEDLALLETQDNSEVLAASSRDVPTRMYFIENASKGKSTNVLNFYFFFKATTPNSRKELANILSRAKKEPYVTSVICPSKTNCSANNNQDDFLSATTRVEIKEVCPGESAWVIIRGVNEYKNLPNGSYVAFGFLDEKNWKYKHADVSDFPVPICTNTSKSRTITTTKSVTSSTVVGGVDFSKFERVTK